MYFDYEGYALECFKNPIFPLLIAIPMICNAIYSVMWIIKKKQYDMQHILKDIFMLLIAGYFVCTSVGHLLYGGMYLLFEQEKDAVKMQGYISDITDLGRFAFPIMESDYGYGDANGVEFTIDEVKCSAPLKGTLMVGDYVEVEYLPKSGYILFIDRVETE